MEVTIEENHIKLRLNMLKNRSQGQKTKYEAKQV